MKLITQIHNKLNTIYKDQDLETAKSLFDSLINEYNKKEFKITDTLTQKNVYLITYGDSFIEKDKKPLNVLGEVLDHTLSETITDVHLLPMFPYTSDDGFSVVDYDQINPELGDWEDISQLSNRYRLMFDFVANHMSKSSPWFKSFLVNQPGYEDLFVSYSDDFDTSNVVRPRTSPLFHEYTESGHTKKVWSTFSEDQVDVEVRSPQTLYRLTKVLLDYALKGASSIRLDAIGFLWKESGTSCMHLPQTHAIIQLWNIILKEYAANTQLITETNVPHEENISYFGDGENEAHQVYQFPLPPLVLYSFLKQDAKKLSTWAETIDSVSNNATYFNFLASHDGIGLRPTEGILTDDDRALLVENVKRNGGRISYKNNVDGTQSVYEMNINYSEALKSGENDLFVVQKMLAAHHILLSIVGVPAIYYHSIFGSKNDEQAVIDSGINRRINRAKLEKNSLFDELENDEYRKSIHNGIKEMIEIRQQHAEFDPYNTQVIHKLDDRLFCVERPLDSETIISITNVSAEQLEITEINGLDLISGKQIEAGYKIEPYGRLWIKKEMR